MPKKVVIYVDFWNIMLSWIQYRNSIDPANRVDIPWGEKFSDTLISLTDPTDEHKSTRVYASVDLSSYKDRKLNYFFDTVLKKTPKYIVDVKKRKEATPPYCPNTVCGKPLGICPECKTRLKFYKEKGVDTELALDMFEAAVFKRCDKIILVSNDSDYIPAVKKALALGIPVIHAGFNLMASPPPIRGICNSYIEMEHAAPIMIAP